MAIAPEIDRIETPLGNRRDDVYLLVGDERSARLDRGAGHLELLANVGEVVIDTSAAPTRIAGSR